MNDPSDTVVHIDGAAVLQLAELQVVAMAVDLRAAFADTSHAFGS